MTKTTSRASEATSLRESLIGETVQSLKKLLRALKAHQLVFQQLVDGLPDHGEPGDGVDVLQNGRSSLRDVVMDPD